MDEEAWHIGQRMVLPRSTGSAWLRQDDVTHTYCHADGAHDADVKQAVPESLWDERVVHVIDTQGQSAVGAAQHEIQYWDLVCC